VLCHYTNLDKKNRGTRRGGCPYIWIDGEGYDKSIWALLGASKEAEDDTGGSPIIVLVNIGAEGSPVGVIDSEACRSALASIRLPSNCAPRASLARDDKFWVRFLP
jgi:hypothetical protein